jgi:hypothetical protein
MSAQPKPDRLARRRWTVVPVPARVLAIAGSDQVDARAAAPGSGPGCTPHRWTWRWATASGPRSRIRTASGKAAASRLRIMSGRSQNIAWKRAWACSRTSQTRTGSPPPEGWPTGGRAPPRSASRCSRLMPSLTGAAPGPPRHPSACAAGPDPASQLRSGAHERRRGGSGGEAAGQAPVSCLVWVGRRVEAGALDQPSSNRKESSDGRQPQRSGGAGGPCRHRAA